MVFRWFFYKRNKRMFDETPLQRILRMALVGLLFAGVLWGFWANSERRLTEVQKISEKRADATRTLTSEQEKRLLEFTRRTFETYGVALRVEIRNAPFDEKQLQEAEKSGTVFLGLVPKERTVFLHVTPLARKALGEPLIMYLRYAHFMPYFAGGNWPEGLAAALNLIGRQLEHHIRGSASG